MLAMRKKLDPGELHFCGVRVTSRPFSTANHGIITKAKVIIKELLNSRVVFQLHDLCFRRGANAKFGALIHVVGFCVSLFGEAE